MDCPESSVLTNIIMSAWSGTLFVTRWGDLHIYLHTYNNYILTILTYLQHLQSVERFLQ